MTRKDAAKLAAAIRSIGDLRGSDRATVRAIVQALRVSFDEDLPRTFGSEATGVIDLSGRDHIADLKARAS